MAKLLKICDAFLVRTFVYYRLVCDPLFYQDGNMGLVKQAASVLTKRKIMQLTHTYITLPLSGKPDAAVAERVICS